ncbi:MAG: DUF2974 domain-containing protein [Blautia sp.]|nr:DUF2974 domain-containing protein [Blautia sp.]
MADLIEYVRWRGDLSFRERPFNDVDNLIFSQIVYHSFDGIVPGTDTKGKISIKEAVKQYLNHPDAGGFPGLDQERNDEFLKLAAESVRFGMVEMSDYVNVVFNEQDGRRTQFCALVYHLPDRSKYIAFRGTDSTIVGWREDFMISYKETDAQQQALAYTKQMLKKYRRHKTVWRVGGHSKGGNLAVYSFAGLDQSLQDKFCAFYNNDGPGFDPEVFGSIEQDVREKMLSRYHKFVTTYDVIGMLFAEKEVRENPEEQPWLTIVASSAKGLMQHWMLTWQVLPDGFETRDKLENGAQAIGDVLDRWVHSASLEEREAFISTLFDAIEKEGSDIVEALSDAKRTAKDVIRELMNGNHKTRDMSRKLIAILGAKASQQLGGSALNVAETAFSAVKKGTLQLQSLAGKVRFPKAYPKRKTGKCQRLQRPPKVNRRRRKKTAQRGRHVDDIL